MKLNYRNGCIFSLSLITLMGCTSFKEEIIKQQKTGQIYIDLAKQPVPSLYLTEDDIKDNCDAAKKTINYLELLLEADKSHLDIALGREIRNESRDSLTISLRKYQSLFEKHCEESNSED